MRFRNPEGIQKSETFPKLSQARAFANAVEADKSQGRYLDAARGRILFRDWAEMWLASMSFGPSTSEIARHQLDKHILPTFGEQTLLAITTSGVQSWVKSRSTTLAPRTVAQLHQRVSQILAAAVNDDRIGKNKAHKSLIRLPTVEKRRLVPWTFEQVQSLYDELPESMRIALVLGTGLGLRQGETFGLSVDDIDFLGGQRAMVTVQRQVLMLGGKLVFALPKHNVVRQVPLPESVAMELARHLDARPARSITLPWGNLDGEARTFPLVLTSRESNAMDRNYFNEKIWRPARRRAHIADTRENGTHAARHFYASVQLEAGTNIKALSEYLGHSSVSFTLDTYTHLMPQAEGRARRAVDDLFGSVIADETEVSRGLSVAQRPT